MPIQEEHKQNIIRLDQTNQASQPKEIFKDSKN